MLARQHLRCIVFMFACATMLLVSKARAGIVRIQITSIESPAFGGKTFGTVGAYEKIQGKAFGEVYPNLPQNTGITDIQLAPRNANGIVEYSIDFYILKPIDLNKGNHKLFEEIPNRGSKLFGGLNKSSGGNNPTTAEQAGEGFLMNMGYTIAWCGWDISAQPINNNITITVPVAKNKDGSTVTGLSYEYISFDNAITTNYLLTYAAADLNKQNATLTYRQLLSDVAQTIPASGWEYADDKTIHLLPAGTPFKQSAIYEFYYQGKNPLVAGLGLASTRDFVSFLRHGKTDKIGTANPLAGYLQYAYSFAISQPARYMNDFEALGFNLDEQGRLVFDGIENWLGGASGGNINYRFAQPDRTERNRQNHLYPEGVFPFAYPVIKDAYSNITSGRIAGYGKTGKLPKVMAINSANEYWVKAASLLHTDAEGNDLPDPPNVRFYLLAGMQHGSGEGKGICQQLQNPTRAEPVLRALFVALDEWVTKGTLPPQSNVPRRKNGTAAMAVETPGALTGNVPAQALHWPNIPNVTYTGLVTIRHRFEYGPEFNKCIIAQYPAIGKPYPAYKNFVSMLDADGNEITGIRLPPVAAPVATLTGWALRSEAFGKNDGGESAGQCIPFAITKAQRLATGDPRPSLEERYKTHAGYVKAVTEAVQHLVALRLLLPEDANNYIKDAEQSNVLK